MPSSGLVHRGRTDDVGVAEQVAGALRAAARARRQHHQLPKTLLRDAFDGASAHGDGRVSCGEFVAAALRLGLVVPRTDALAVFRTAGELVIIAPISDVSAATTKREDATKKTTTEKTETAGGAEAEPAAEMLLIYAPWIDDVIDGPRRPSSTPSVSAAASGDPVAGTRPNTASGRTRRGPLKETDAIAKENDAFVYPQCRTPVFAPRGWGARHAARGVAAPETTLRLDHVHGGGLYKLISSWTHSA
jgi:hypothetical protein